MARGWDSKSIEDQIRQKEEQSQEPAAPKLTRDEAALRQKREGLMLARARTVADLESARDTRYRALLERTLTYLDAQIADIDKPA